MRAMSALALLLTAAAAHAQCSSFQPAYPGLNGEVRALASWTPDGVAPQLPRLMAGGANPENMLWWAGRIDESNTLSDSQVKSSGKNLSMFYVIANFIPPGIGPDE